MFNILDNTMSNFHMYQCIERPTKNESVNIFGNIFLVLWPIYLKLSSKDSLDNPSRNLMIEDFPSNNYSAMLGTPAMFRNCSLLAHLFSY